MLKFYILIGLEEFLNLRLKSYKSYRVIFNSVIEKNAKNEYGLFNN